jgi:uncharacterized protein
MTTASGCFAETARALASARRRASASGRSAGSGVSSTSGAITSNGKRSRKSNSLRYREVEPRIKRLVALAVNKGAVSLKLMLARELMHGFSYTARMSRPDPFARIDVRSLAERGEPVSGTLLLQKMERLAPDLLGLQPDSAINWQIQCMFRPAPDGQPAVWLHLKGDTVLALACQRCLEPVDMPVRLDREYRFVDSEEIALAEDDESEQDLLVMEPQFDLAGLIEDELLLAVPVVPLHAVCPTPVSMQAGEADMPVQLDEAKPNPFAVLSKLKKPTD